MARKSKTAPTAPSGRTSETDPTPVATLICTDLKLSERELTVLRDRFQGVLIDVLGDRLPEPSMEVFPIDFSPKPPEALKKSPKR